MYINSSPVGANPPLEENRMPIWKVTNGDSLILHTLAHMPRSGVLATPENSILTFVLSQDQFDKLAFWTGTWRDGIEPIIGDATRPGYVAIRIPDSISGRMRRGSYQFSLTVTDVATKEVETLLNAYMLTEYVPGSPSHSIPYVWEPEQQVWEQVLRLLQDSDLI